MGSKRSRIGRWARRGPSALAALCLASLVLGCGGSSAEGAESQCREALARSAERAVARAGGNEANAQRHAVNVAGAVEKSFLARCRQMPSDERARFVSCVTQAEDHAEATKCGGNR